MPDNYELDASKYMEAKRRQAFAVLAWLTERMEESDMADMQLLKVDVQGPAHTGGEYRAVLKGRDGSGQVWVAFANGSDVAALLAAIKQQSDTRGIMWRPDKPYNPGG